MYFRAFAPHLYFLDKSVALNNLRSVRYANTGSVNIPPVAEEMARRKNRVSHTKEIFYISCILVFLLIALLTLLGPEGYLEMKKVELQYETHRKEVEAIRENNDALMRSVRSFKSDREALEDYARKKGFAQKGEIVQELPRKETP